MTLLTTKCDISIIISKEKSQKFRDYKPNEKIVKENRILTDKIVKRIVSKDL